MFARVVLSVKDTTARSLVSVISSLCIFLSPVFEIRILFHTSVYSCEPPAIAPDRSLIFIDALSPLRVPISHS